jgi:hypothetical protein
MPSPSRRHLAGVALISATLLMIELALTRIFSVVMYYHFAFLAISIALFGVSASGVYAYVRRHRLDRRPTDDLLAAQSLIYAACTIVALFVLVRLRVGLSYSPSNLARMLTIYTLAAVPFFAGGLVVTMAISRMSAHVNAVYAADLIGAAAGCLILIPCSIASARRASCWPRRPCPPPPRSCSRRARAAAASPPLRSSSCSCRSPANGPAVRDSMSSTPRGTSAIAFCSASGIRSRASASTIGPTATGRSAIPIPAPCLIRVRDTTRRHRRRSCTNADLSNAHLRYELTASRVSLEGTAGFTALVIGPGGGRDLASALVFGASRVDGVEINPIIADAVMRDRFREFSGGIYVNPRVHVTVDDGRSFVRRTSGRYDVIQASLVDTWAATAAGAYTLTENTLYTVEAFNDYLDHLTDGGILTITRWVADGLRLVSLAQAACEQRGWSAADRLAIVRQDNVATFMLKKTPFTASEIVQLRGVAGRLGFDVLYAPGDGDALSGAQKDGRAQSVHLAQNVDVDGSSTADYARLVLAPDRQQFYAAYRWDIRPTSDDRPFFFHTTKLENQFDVAFGRTMLFGNGLSALMTLLGISTAPVVLFVIGPLIFAGRT